MRIKFPFVALYVLFSSFHFYFPWWFGHLISLLVSVPSAFLLLHIINIFFIISIWIQFKLPFISVKFPYFLIFFRKHWGYFIHFPYFYFETLTMILLIFRKICKVYWYTPTHTTHKTSSSGKFLHFQLFVKNLSISSLVFLK